MILYIDDNLIVRSNDNEIDELNMVLKMKFKIITDSLDLFLGIQIAIK